MTSKCKSCGHEFTNVFLREYCPRCKDLIKRPSAQPVAATYQGSARPADDEFEVSGFALGMVTGVPLQEPRG